MKANCLHCGTGYELKPQQKSGKHFFCQEEECKEAGMAYRKELQRIASQKWRDNVASGTAKKYKKKKSRETGRTCKKCDKPIKRYKVNGAWIMPYWFCKECRDKMDKYQTSLDSTGRGGMAERMDGDYMFMGV